MDLKSIKYSIKVNYFKSGPSKVTAGRFPLHGKIFKKVIFSLIFFIGWEGGERARGRPGGRRGEKRERIIFPNFPSFLYFFTFLLFFCRFHKAFSHWANINPPLLLSAPSSSTSTSSTTSSFSSLWADDEKNTVKNVQVGALGFLGILEGSAYSAARESRGVPLCPDALGFFGIRWLCCGLPGVASSPEGFFRDS